MPKANPIIREIFMQYSRPLFRTCEIICNHAARIFLNKNRLNDPYIRNQLDALNSQREYFQRELNEIGNSHGHVCAECKGRCCGSERERDAFIDRILQYPNTEHLQTRRKTGEMVAYNIMRRDSRSIAVADGESCPGFCRELTTKGCKIPYELRPIQCTAYFCRPTVNELSGTECSRGIRALSGLMGIEIRTVMLAIRSRLS